MNTQIKPKVGDKTRYGIITELVVINGITMMRSDFPYGTWPIEQIIPNKIN